MPPEEPLKPTARIVHIDDSEQNRYLVRRIAESAGYSVEQAATGAEALQLLDRITPDLIILDIKLPDTTGYDLCRGIRQRPETAFIPILQISSHFTDAEARVLGLDSGADAYLAKINPTEVLATIRALLRAREAEEIATAAAGEWQCTFDSVSDPILVLDEGCEPIKMNRAAETLVRSLTSDEVERLLDHIRRANTASQTGEVPDLPVTQELNIRNHIFAMRVDSMPAVAQCNSARLVTVLMDMTASRQAEAEIRHMNDQLLLASDAAVQANRTKSAFMASMSHELRTPLNAIIGYTELMKEDATGRGDSSAVDDLDKISSSAAHLLGLVTEILDLSKIEAGRTDLHLDSFEVRGLVKDVVAALAPLARQKGNVIQTSFQDNVGAIWTDGSRLRQILLNLLGNACKFTQDGTITIFVQRFIRNFKEYVSFAVHDTGIGIDEDKLVSVFNDYDQGEDHISATYGGTGLGLPISNRLAHLLGGELSVTSQKGRGSRFTVTVLSNMQDHQDNFANT